MAPQSAKREVSGALEAHKNYLDKAVWYSVVRPECTAALHGAQKNACCVNSQSSPKAKFMLGHVVGGQMIAGS